MTEQLTERQKALQELKEDRCFCGLPKVSGQSFCRSCYFTLPDSWRRTLYARFGSGYEQALAKAKDYLREKLPRVRGAG